MKSYFDPKRKLLVCYRANSTPDFWDSHWNGAERDEIDIVGTKDTHVSRVTKKYLNPEEGIILEGGCGTGEHVAALVNNGYRCIGIDFAEKTVSAIQQRFPELDIRYGDVRALPFEDGFFAGYWSVGVIEHSWEGYGTILSEMARVLRREGYLFLSFPYMSPLRKMKSRFNAYESFRDENPDGFYQFILDAKSVLEDLRAYRFDLIDARPWDGLKGTKDEIRAVKPLLQSLYDYRGENAFIKRWKGAVDNLLSSIAAHNILLILKKNSP